MKIPVRVVCAAWFGAVALLSGCGGGGDGGDAVAAAPPPAAAACEPDEYGALTLEVATPRAEVISRLKCDGRVVSDIVLQGVRIEIRDWGVMDAGRYAQVTFHDGKAHEILTQGLHARTGPVCPPTARVAEAFPVGQDVGIDQVVALRSCPSDSVRDVRTAGLLSSTYTWGRPDAGPFLMVEIQNRSVKNRVSQNL